MCGIIGLSIKSDSDIKNKYSDILQELFLLSETRGKEASGVALYDGKSIQYLKTPRSASELIGSKIYKQTITEFVANKNAEYYSAFGHSRLVTDGYEHLSYNNQPVVRDGMVVIHNGIIVNTNELLKKYSPSKLTDLDSEFIPILLKKHLGDTNDYKRALTKFYDDIYGMTTFALFSEKINNLILATNNGSAYFIKSKADDAFVFASERYILEALIENQNLEQFFQPEAIVQLKPLSSCVVDLATLEFDVVELKSSSQEFSVINLNTKQVLKIEEISLEPHLKASEVNTSLDHSFEQIPQGLLDFYHNRVNAISSLKRCSKCILPETFPFIEFGNDGVCNYCSNHKKLVFKGKEPFVDILEKLRNKDPRKPDFLVPFSGGRDSSYALHYLKKELGFNPIAYSYDWGMLTDLGRRNQARMCGALGVEHILISADIRKKRKNIRKNVLAWLKRPSLGTVPLFMAGDKQYFYFSNQLMKQNNLKLSIMGENMLETTQFKSGFCGISPSFGNEHTNTLSTKSKLRMMYFYGKEFLLNPSYLNSSIWDTLDAFKSYYVMEHETINIFDYLKWDEGLVNDVLLNQYDWEIDPGTSTTWRIGDGTAAFYNYIYFVLAGFTEFDTFRSNQVREGTLSRIDAIELAREENNVRWDSIQWYCRTIGVDWIKTIETINRAKSLYK